MGDATDSTARHVFVEGRVQGVAFRWATRTRARELGVAGWVQNLPDGRVEAWIEGAPPAVEAMLAWIRVGPPGARVEAIGAVEAAAGGHTGFEIRRA